MYVRGEWGVGCGFFIRVGGVYYFFFLCRFFMRGWDRSYILYYLVVIFVFRLFVLSFSIVLRIRVKIGENLLEVEEMRV